MLVVVAIIGILVSMILPALQSAKAKAKAAQCGANLKEMGLAFHMFMHDHDSLFPMSVSTNEGGTLEYTQASYLLANEFFFEFRHFQALSNDLVSPALLVCPVDRTRFIADNFGAMNNFNVSYFAGANADYSEPNSILAGDRNITNAAAGSVSMIRVTGNTFVTWTGEMHMFKGNILYSDGHVSELNTQGLALASSGSPAVMDVMIPTVNAPPPTSPPQYYSPPAPPAYKQLPPPSQLFAKPAQPPPPASPTRAPMMSPSGMSSGNPMAGSKPVSRPATPSPIAPAADNTIIHLPKRVTNTIVLAKPTETPETNIDPIIIASTPVRHSYHFASFICWFLIILLLLAGAEAVRRVTRNTPPQRIPPPPSNQKK
jgi:prepilin-type processing-associated H-X9-DG protein